VYDTREMFCNIQNALLLPAIYNGTDRLFGLGHVAHRLPFAAQGTDLVMSKAFITAVLQESATLTGTAANRAAGALMAAIVKEMKKNGKFTLPSFGTFTVRKTKARKGLNPRTGEKIKVKAGKTVRFKASPTLKKSV
jgi:DNA-binding protein HU-beta